MRHWVFLVGLELMAAGGRVIDFDGVTPGAMPPGWSMPASAGSTTPWEVRQDQTAPTKPYILAGNSVPLAILDGTTLRNGDVSVRIKPVAGQSGGIVWRYRDERNYYVVRASAADRTVAVFRVRDGQTARLGSAAKYDISANSWNILKVSAKGARFQIYVDHRRVLEGYDSAFLTAGQVGLSTVAESYFDDFRVNPR